MAVRTQRVRPSGGGHGATDQAEVPVVGGRPRRPIPTTLLRIVLVGAMCAVLAVIAGGRAFDELVWPLLVPPPLVTAAGWLCYRRPLLVRYAVLVAMVSIAGRRSPVCSPAPD